MNRKPFLRFPDLKISSATYEKESDEIILRIKPESWLFSDLSAVLEQLTSLVGTLRRHQEGIEREQKVDELVEHRRLRILELSRAYQRLRLSGMKHRAAIRALFVDPSFSDLNATQSDIAYYVKVKA